MLHAVIIVTLLMAHGCHGADNSSRPRQPAAAALVMGSRRRPADLLASLRRQLMRDNYDYQNANTDDEANRLRQQKGGGKNNTFIPRTRLDENNRVNAANKQEVNDTDQLHDAHEVIVEQDARDTPRVNLNYAHESTYAHDTHANDPDQHNAYDPTYGSDTRAALGPNYQPDRHGVRSPAPDRRQPGEQPAWRPGTHHLRSVKDTSDSLDTAYPKNEDTRHKGDAPDKYFPPKTYKETNDDLPIFREPGHKAGTDKKIPHEPKQIKKSEESYSNRAKQFKPKKPSGAQRGAPDHAIDKKDLLYYMDDARLRRNNHVSADLSCPYSDADEPHTHDKAHADDATAAGAHHSAVRRFAAVHSSHSGSGGELDASDVSLSDSSRSNSSSLEGASELSDVRDQPSDTPATPAEVTESAANTTYKLLTMRRRRSGRRSAGRRFVEERGSGGVALIRVDAGPFPQFRLPRARRQYMLERNDPRPPLADAAGRRRHSH